MKERLCAPKRVSNQSASCIPGPPGSRAPCACVCVCVCERERETQTDREREREREREIEQERDCARKPECQIILFIALFQEFVLLLCVSKRE